MKQKAGQDVNPIPRGEGRTVNNERAAPADRPSFG